MNLSTYRNLIFSYLFHRSDSSYDTKSSQSGRLEDLVELPHYLSSEAVGLGLSPAGGLADVVVTSVTMGGANMLASGGGITPGVVFPVNAVVEPDRSTQELLASILAADAALLAPTRESTIWALAEPNTISEYNENYRCTLLGIGACEDSLLYIRFVVKTDGSLGPLQLPQASRLTLGSLEPVTAVSAVYAVEDPMSQYAGTLIFNIAPLLECIMDSGVDLDSEPRFQFMYGETGYSTTTFRLPDPDVHSPGNELSLSNVTQTSPAEATAAFVSTHVYIAAYYSEDDYTKMVKFQLKLSEAGEIAVKALGARYKCGDFTSTAEAANDAWSSSEEFSVATSVSASGYGVAALQGTVGGMKPVSAERQKWLR